MDIEHLSKTIIEFYERLSSWEEAVVRDSGMTTAQVHTVEMIGHCGPIKMKDLAEKIGVTTGTLTVAIDRLEKKHLVRRKPHDSDRRAYLIELTEEGHECFVEHHDFHIRMTQDIAAELTPEEQVCFERLLEKVLAKI